MGDSSTDPLLGEPKVHSARYKHGRRTQCQGILWAVLLIHAVVGWTLAIFVVVWAAPLLPWHGDLRIPDPYRQQADNATPSAHPAAPAPWKKLVSIDHIVDRAWSPRYPSLSWKHGESGGEEWLVEQLKSSNAPFLQAQKFTSQHALSSVPPGKVLIEQPEVFYEDRRIDIHSAWPSPGLNSILIASNFTKVWRHSFTGLYWIFDRVKREVYPLDPEARFERVQLACWSPDGEAVAFVRENNIYLRHLGRAQLSKSPSVVQLTHDGTEDVMYGVPGWVYEEEVLEDRTAMWWSPDGRFLAFLRTNESLVTEFAMPYYIQPNAALPSQRSIRYPRPGSPNPIVSLHFYDRQTGLGWEVTSPDEFHDDQRVIFHVMWLSPTLILMKQTDRESDVLKVFLVDTIMNITTLVRQEDIRALDGGWVETIRSTKAVPADPANGRPEGGYVDTIVYNGFNHLAYFSPPNASKPVCLLTSGLWQVVDAPSAVDLNNNAVYFLAAVSSPGERSLYRVGLDGRGFQQIDVGFEGPAYYSVDFSPSAKHAILTYHGSGIPHLSLITLDPRHSSGVAIKITLDENKHLLSMAAEYHLPSEVHHSIPISGTNISVVERLPPNFDPNKQYPTVFYMYGGPGSQTVNRKFKVDFQTYLASQGYVVVTVDGRGTGFNGRRFQSVVRDRIGYFEAQDQIHIAKMWKKHSYVDASRMAVWGWSFGGFLTLKVLETDAGETFQYGMAVAPVTDWRFYDSIHTERHMRTPQHNPTGYEAAALSNMTAFNQTVRFFISHGTADDNVHIQNTFSFVDKLTRAGVMNYELSVFPDSDHDIMFHNAEKVIYSRMAEWLERAFSGKWR